MFISSGALTGFLRRSGVVIGLSLAAVACGSGVATTTTTSTSTTPSSAVTTTTIQATTTTAQSECLDLEYEATCYAVGDIGPGGGIIFYAGYGVLGSSCSPLCRYLEVAPTEIPSAQAWCNDPSLFMDATNWGMGEGESNTLTYKNFCRSGAIAAAANYVSPDGTDDWYLPSGGELNELCKFARTQPTGNPRTPCVENGYLQVGFTDGAYWSSTELKATDSRFGQSAWAQSFSNGETYNTRKTAELLVIAIRMF